jgi:3'(2'), 5'-bisphosphate nucleotidase
MVRIPRRLEKRSFVCDHAGGHLIFEEAGGKILDLTGKGSTWVLGGDWRRIPA